MIVTIESQLFYNIKVKQEVEDFIHSQSQSCLLQVLNATGGVEFSRE